MTDDDDLPVLTQILRTGSGVRVATTPHDEDGATGLDVRPVSGLSIATSYAAPLDSPEADVASAHDEDDATGTGAAVDGVDAADAGASNGHPDTGAHADARPDAFVLPQDHDVALPHPSPRIVLDEPALALSNEAPAAAPDPVEPARPDTSADHWHAVSERVRTMVLDDLGPRIDTEFDARIAQAMHAEIETALAHLQGALRDHVAHALRDVVGRAVDAEVARLRATPMEPATPPG